MERKDTSRLQDDELERCSDCCAELLSTSHPTYAFGAAGVLCFACAERRGGSFDGRLDRWTAQPDTRDLGPRERD